MRNAASRRRDAARARTLRPKVEGLEDRLLLFATNGGSWTYPVRVTFSFLPDGTNIGGYGSNLNAGLNAEGITTAAWQNAFQQAAAYWEAYANINLVQVPDNGAPLGSAGNQQGDSRFGDIRIGGLAQGSNGYLAYTYLPPPMNGGTLASDIVFNTSIAWQIGGNYDLQTVALHELGHALGLDHSSDGTAAMAAIYNGIKPAPTTDDIQGIQSIYGARTADWMNTSANADPINFHGGLTAQWEGVNIASPAAADWYQLTVPAGSSTTLTISMQTTGLSQLSPRVVLFDGSLRGLNGVSAYSAGSGATATLTYSPVYPGQVYYIKALAAQAGPSGAGAYGMQVNLTGASLNPLPPPNTAVATQPDSGTNPAEAETTHGRRGPAPAAAEPPVVIGTLSGNGDGLTVAPRRGTPAATTHGHHPKGPAGAHAKVVASARVTHAAPALHPTRTGTTATHHAPKRHHVGA